MRSQWLLFLSIIFILNLYYIQIKVRHIYNGRHHKLEQHTFYHSICFKSQKKGVHTNTIEVLNNAQKILVGYHNLNKRQTVDSLDILYENERTKKGYGMRLLML